MKLSTRGRYGLRTLIDLSCQPQSAIVTLASIAERQDISVHYLEKIASDLKRAGYIHSIKGPHGGYMLAVKPENIIIGDLLKLLEGDMRLTDSYIGEESLLQECIRNEVYDVLNEKIAKLVDSITLENILDNCI